MGVRRDYLGHGAYRRCNQNLHYKSAPLAHGGDLPTDGLAGYPRHSGDGGGYARVCVDLACSRRALFYAGSGGLYQQEA